MAKGKAPAEEAGRELLPQTPRHPPFIPPSRITQRREDSFRTPRTRESRGQSGCPGGGCLWWKPGPPGTFLRHEPRVLLSQGLLEPRELLLHRIYRDRSVMESHQPGSTAEKAAGPWEWVSSRYSHSEEGAGLGPRATCAWLTFSSWGFRLFLSLKFHSLRP